MKTDTTDLITQAEAARIRGVSREAIYDLVSRDKFTVTEIGGQKFLSRSEVESYKPQSAGRPRKQRTGRPSKRKGKTK